jgi:hypothetical protein
VAAQVARVAPAAVRADLVAPADREADRKTAIRIVRNVPTVRHPNKLARGEQSPALL